MASTAVSHFLRPTVRYTNVTDTVLGIGVETTIVAEEAIEKGRCVEFYVTDEDKRGMLKTKIHDAFRTAHGRGMFQVRAVNSNDHSGPCVSSVSRVSPVDV